MTGFATLDQLAEISGGWTTAAADTGSVRLLRTTDIAGGSVDWAAVPYCKTPPRGGGRMLLKHGDLVIARTGVGSVGNVAIVLDPPAAVHASYLIRLRVNQAISPHFLLWYLRTSEGRAQLMDRSVGSVIPNLSAKRLGGVRVPERELADQLEIADAIETSAHSYELAAQALKRARSHVDGIRKNSWQVAIEANKIDPNSWPTAPLEEVATFRDRDRVPLNRSQRGLQPGHTPYYGASGVIDRISGHTHAGEFLLVSEDGQNLESRKQDIAFAVDGEFWANNHIHVLELREGLIPSFIAAYLNGTRLVEYLTGTAQPKLPLNRLRRIPVPLPSIETQRAIASSVNTLRANTTQWSSSLQDMESAMSAAWQAYLDRVYGQQVADESEKMAGPAPAERLTGELRRETVVYKTIEEALRANPEGLTPEHLYDDVELPGADDEERVDRFYESLRSLLADGKVIEQREEDRIMLRLS